MIQEKKIYLILKIASVLWLSLYLSANAEYYEPEPIDIEFDPGSGESGDGGSNNREHHDRAEVDRDRNEKEKDKKKREAQKRKKEAEKREIARKKAERRKIILKANNQVFMLMTFDTQSRLTEAENYYSKMSQLDLDYLGALTNHLNKLSKKDALLLKIENNIKALRNDISKLDSSTLNYAHLATAVSHLCDKVLYLLSYSANYTGSSAAATRIEFINSAMKEYINSDDKTVEWLIEQIYGYSVSNYVSNTNRDLLVNIEILYSFKKMANDMQRNEDSFKDYKETLAEEITKLESMYAKQYEKLKELRKEFSTFDGIEKYPKQVMKKLKPKIDYYKYQIEESRTEANILVPPM